jgi:hypothetical protein
MELGTTSSVEGGRGGFWGVQISPNPSFLKRGIDAETFSVEKNAFGAL